MMNSAIRYQYPNVFVMQPLHNAQHIHSQCPSYVCHHPKPGQRSHNANIDDSQGQEGKCLPTTDLATSLQPEHRRQYSAHATARGQGRNGHVTSENLDLRLASPKVLGGSGDGQNPEQLFAMGYACTQTTLSTTYTHWFIDLIFLSPLV